MEPKAGDVGDMEQMKFEREQVIGFVGAALLIVGCFAPLVHLPIIGGISYVANGRGDGMLVVGLAIVSAALVYFRLYRWVLVSAAGVAGLCIFTLWRFLSLGSQIRDQVANSAKDNAFGNLAAAFADAVSLGWGWAFLLLGLACLFAAAGMALVKQRPTSTAYKLPISLPVEGSLKEAAADAGPRVRSEPRTTFGQRR